MAPPDSQNGAPLARRPATSAPATVLDVPTVPRELDAWAAAVVHLHRAGSPAAVPPFAAAWLARCGIRADWVGAA